MKTLSVALQDCVPRALSTGVLTTVAVALCGQIENGNAVAPINAISHIVWDDDALDKDDLSLKYSGVASLINLSAHGGWALIYEFFFGELRDEGKKARPMTGALAVSLLAYLIDYHIVPPRLTPGMEHRLSRRALWPIYAALALGLWLPRGKKRRES